MTTRRAIVGIERWLFAHHRLVIGLLALVTLALGAVALQLRVDPGFEKHLPVHHPYMRTFREYREPFWGADRLLIVLRARDGDMFTPAFFERLEAMTDAVFFLPGIDRARVRSLFTSNVRFIEIVEQGFVGGTVMPTDFAPTPDGFATVRRNAIQAGIVGRLVANNFSAALISAELVEVDPATGEHPDYALIAQRLESEIRARFEDERFTVHIIGFAKAIGDITDAAGEVGLFFLLALALTAVLVFAFFRSLIATTLVLGSSLITAVWGSGLLVLAGYGLDPMSILVPFLVFAIAVSHATQMVAAAGRQAAAGRTAENAAQRAFRRLIVPGAMAILSDGAGFLTLLVIDVPIIRELGVGAALGVLSIVLTHFAMLPLLLARIPVRMVPRRRGPALGVLSGVAQPSRDRMVLGGALGLLAIGLVGASGVSVGDLQPGVPELRPGSRYNRDARIITSSFAIGVDVLQVIVEGPPDACVDPGLMRAIDRFAWHLENVEGVRSTLALPGVAKIANAGLNEGNLAWRVIPDQPDSLAQAVAPVETASGLLNGDCSVMPVIAFTADHRAPTIDRLVGAIEADLAANPTAGLDFRLATGNLGIMAASNDVVRGAQVPMLLGIYAIVTLLCLLSFRSFAATACIVLPLALVSVLVFALMAALGVGLKPATLPVAALGVGIGVDYGLYVFAALRRHLDRGAPFDAAWQATIREEARIVLLTGLALSAAVLTWVLSGLQFQADMGLLLAFMLFANMLGALVVLPAIARLLIKSATPGRTPGSAG